MQTHKRIFQVVIKRDEDGIYVATVPALTGCHTQGDTLQEVEANIHEAIEAYLESMQKDEKPTISFVKISKVEVAV